MDAAQPDRVPSSGPAASHAEDPGEEQIALWRAYVERHDAIGQADVRELEGHLRDQIEELTASGLDRDEAFLVAIKRMGSLDALSREFAREHSDRLWKQLVVPPGATPTRTRGLALALGLAGLAAVAIKLPALFGLGFPAAGEFYARNVALLVLPFLAVLFLVRRRAGVGTVAVVAASFVVAALVVNGYPFEPRGATLLLTVVHTAVVLWLVVGVAYVGGDWRSGSARMDFIRFTGEWFVYLVLIGLGGALLQGLAVALFHAVGLSVDWFLAEWMIPCGFAGAIVVAGWLVEAKQSVIENIAPVLARIFTPLFALLLIAFVVVTVWQGRIAMADGIQVFGQRDQLILFDVVLIVVLGLLLYSMSARDPLAPAGWFEVLQLVLVVAALAVDAIVLFAMVERIGSFGMSPNKLASLGLNLILLVNLAVAAWLQVAFLRRRVAFARLDAWQTSYVPIYFVWAVAVAVVFPPAFGFG
ncbi:permease prefix domain 1-containing protein [Microbacterium sp.]|uniref:permease prefix domain 1-containing protein n=1 Tax=Microbacterium sp. TaxID=51671 RepID=UPI003C78AA14